MGKEIIKINSSTKLAQKYEIAWHTLFYQLPRWKQEAITKDPNDRYADELAHDAAKLAESEDFNPVKAKYAGEVKKEED